MNALSLLDERDVWEVGTTYVIGHQRPDTDAAASAVGYAWLLRATEEQSNVTQAADSKIVAARAGQLPAQTMFAFNRFGCPIPRLLNGVAPLFAHITGHHKALNCDAPLSEAMQQMADGQQIVPILDAENKPLGVVTPMALARVYSAISQNPQEVAAILAQPCREGVESIPTFRLKQRISDLRRVLLHSSADDLLVTDETGHYVGIATRSQVLNPPRASLIMVDHNELGQAVSGASEAEIIAVLDHHRLGNAPTALPIPFMVEPVGSTCTLVAERCRAENVVPPSHITGILLSGILSDTLVFHSPTATPRDRQIAEWLAEIANVDIEAYGAELLNVTPGLLARPIADIIDGDRKKYEMGGQAVSIGQVEVTNLQELPQRRAEILEAMQERREQEDLALIALMVTDVVTGTSHLLSQGETSLLAALPFARLGDGEWDLQRIVSRKKQLVPALSDVLEGGA